MAAVKALLRWSWSWSVLAVLFWLSSLPVSAQDYGAVLMANRVPGVLDAPIFEPDGVTGLKSPFAAELWAGPAADQLQLVPSLIPFSSAYDGGSYTNGGYLAPYANLTYNIPGMSAGETAYCQLRVFRWMSVDQNSWEQTRRLGWETGESDVFPVRLGTVANPAPLIGLKSFSVRPPHFGTVRFSNFEMGLLDAPVLDTDGATRLAGSGFMSQLYAKAAAIAGDLQPIGSPAPFQSGGMAGYWDAGTNSVLTLTNVAPGQTAQVQVFVWESAKGATYGQAIRAGSKRGQSAILDVEVGDEGTPPSAPAILNGMLPIRLTLPVPGTVKFNNRVPGKLDVPVLVPTNYWDRVPIQAPYVAQLYAGISANDLQPVSPPAPFGTGNDAGYWQPQGDGTIALAAVPAGEYAYVEVRIWDASFAASYEESAQFRNVGTSGVLKVRTGGAGTPPAEPGLLTGLQSIVVPDAHLVRVLFRNFVPGILDNPVFAADGSKLSGPGYLAQLCVQSWDWPDAGTFKPLSEPVPFGIGDQAGYWQAGSNSVFTVDVAVGCCADFQVRIWEAAQGATFEAATNGVRKVSNPVWFFAGSHHLPPKVLDGLGYLSMRTDAPPALVIQPSSYGFIYDVARTELLSRPGFVGQLYLAAGDTFPLPAYKPYGAVWPIGTGDRAGIWETPTNTLILLPEFKTNHVVYGRLQIWEAAKGNTYEAALQNVGVVGISSVEYFNVQADPQAPPAQFAYPFSNLILSGKLRKVSVPPGLSLIGYPFAEGVTMVRDMLPAAPDGTEFYLFDNASHRYDVNVYDFGLWQNFAQPFAPGQGAFMRNPGKEPIQLEFLGQEGPPEKLIRPEKSPQFYLVGCGSSQPTPIGEFVAGSLADGDAAYRFVNGRWDVSVRDGAGWLGFDPVLNQGEAMFIRLMPAP